jgi:hypothetical protein
VSCARTSAPPVPRETACRRWRSAYSSRPGRWGSLSARSPGWCRRCPCPDACAARTHLGRVTNPPSSGYSPSPARCATSPPQLRHDPRDGPPTAKTTIDRSASTQHTAY